MTFECAPLLAVDEDKLLLFTLEDEIDGVAAVVTPDETKAAKLAGLNNLASG